MGLRHLLRGIKWITTKDVNIIPSDVQARLLVTISQRRGNTIMCPRAFPCDLTRRLLKPDTELITLKPARPTKI